MNLKCTIRDSWGVTIGRYYLINGDKKCYVKGLPKLEIEGATNYLITVNFIFFFFFAKICY